MMNNLILFSLTCYLRLLILIQIILFVASLFKSIVKVIKDFLFLKHLNGLIPKTLEFDWQVMHGQVFSHMIWINWLRITLQ